MNKILRTHSIGIVLLIFLSVFSCKDKCEPESITKGKFLNGIVEIPNDSKNAPGLLFIDFEEDEYDYDLHKPWYGIYYYSDDKFYPDSLVHFEIFKIGNIYYASNVQKGKAEDFNKEKYKEANGIPLVDLHVVGDQDGSKGGSHTKVHIIQHIGSIEILNGEEYKRINVEDKNGAPSHMYVKSQQFDELSLLPIGTEVYFYIVTIVNDKNFGFLTIEHSHNYGPSNENP